MSNVGHTPGPWSFKVAANGDCGVTAGRTGVFIESFADIRHSGEGARDEARASARLVCGAPEMLEVLQLCEGREYNSFEPDNQSALYKNIKAAIAKATGQ